MSWIENKFWKPAGQGVDAFAGMSLADLAKSEGSHMLDEAFEDES